MRRLTHTLDAAATGHIGSVKAIHKGLASRQSGGYFIQISGATAISQHEIKHNRFGESTTKIFNDYDKVDDLKDEIVRHPNRTVDNYFLKLTKETPNVRTAVVFGPIIYGNGEGPVHQRSIQIPELCRLALERGRGVQIGKGLNEWGNVHIADLGELFASLVLKAAEGDTNKDTWGEKGLYFAGAGKEIVSPLNYACREVLLIFSSIQSFGEIARRIVQAAVQKGLIEDEDVESLSADEMDELFPHASAIVGTNAREKAQRAKKVLDWLPQHHSLEDEIPRAVQAEAEARSLGGRG